MSEEKICPFVSNLMPAQTSLGQMQGVPMMFACPKGKCQLWALCSHGEEIVTALKTISERAQFDFKV